MKQMNINPIDLVFVDYESENIPAAIQILQPVVYENCGEFCCILGPDPQQGVFGSGSTPRDAMEAWERSVEARLAESEQEDLIAQFIRESFSRYRYAG